MIGDHDLMSPTLDQAHVATIIPNKSKYQFEKTIYINQIEDCPIND
jgi:hypothetical protein